MAFQRIWDDDPDHGPARYVVVEVLNCTGRGSISLTGDLRQRMNPLDAMRRHGAADEGGAPRTFSPRPRPATCPCGRRMSANAMRCQACVTSERRKPQAWIEALL